jgi:hypothetical protein
MIIKILDASKSDPGLARLLDDVREYACVYVLARQRQKGCDGLGEMTNLKDEFRGVLDDLLAYCKYKGYGYILEEGYDVDSMAVELARAIKQ